MSTIPPISVVMPVFNAAPYVGKAIESILCQTASDFELIVIDDGSSDTSLEAIGAAVGTDRRCRVFSRPNAGLVTTLNEGIDKARGTYVFRMDADDISHPERFAAELEFLEANRDCVVVGTRALLVDPEMMPIMELIGSFTHEEIDAENMRGIGSAFCHPSVAMRRDALVSVGGYRAEFEWAEDLDLFLRLAEFGRLANLDRVLITYRQHMNSVGYSRRRLQLERTASAVADAKRRRGLPGSSEAVVGAAAVHRGGDDVPVLQQRTESQAEVHRRWAWLSLGGGHPRTARKHALKAIRLEPFSHHNAKLLACAIRGR